MTPASFAVLPTSHRRGPFLSLVLLALAAIAGCDDGRSSAPGGAAGSAGGGAAGGSAVGGSAAGGSGASGGSAGTLGGQAGSGGDGGAGGGDGAGGVSGCLPVTPIADPRMAGCPAVAPAPLGEASHPNEGQTHLVVCSTTCYGTNPPSSGNHYGVWPVYKTYSAPVPWGFLVHGLEHGAVVLSYNCPCGCPDEVAAAQAWIDALPQDPVCKTPPRVVMAPDPDLDVRWAASAWTWTLRAESFDPVAFQAFFTAHYNMAPEQICDGYTDGSATGWCQ